MEQRVTGPAIWNGVPVLVTLSEESETGFLNVLKQPGGRNEEEALLRQVQAGWREEAADAAWIIFGHCLGGGLQVRLLLGDEGRAA